MKEIRCKMFIKAQFVLHKFKNFAKRILFLVKKVLQIFCKYIPIMTEERFGPKGYYEKTLEYVEQTGNTSYEKINSSHLILRNEPYTIENEVHWKFLKGCQHLTPDTFVLNIADGRVYGKRGIIITPDNELLHDLSLGFGEPIHLNPAFTRILPNITYRFETIAVLASRGGENFFHWMFDLLPRFELLNKSSISIDRYYINYNGLPFQKDSLEILGIDTSKIIPSSNNFYLQTKNLVVPSYPGRTGNMPKWVCDFLRNKFLKNLYSNNNKNRIYISRNKTRYRKITNENDLVHLLSKYNFEIVYLEKLSLQEQVSVFASAKIIIAPHGAGLSNLVFCANGTKVIEIFSPNYVNICYFALSNQLNLDYYYLIGMGNRPIKYTDPHIVSEDITVNIEQIKTLLQRIII